MAALLQKLKMWKRMKQEIRDLKIGFRILSKTRKRVKKSDIKNAKREVLKTQMSIFTGLSRINNEILNIPVITSLRASVADTSISISFDDSNSSSEDDDDSDYISTKEAQNEEGEDGEAAKAAKRLRKMSMIADEEGLKNELQDFLWFPL